MKFALATAADTHQCAYDEDALIVAALKARGAEARTVIWDQTDPASLAGQTVVIRTPWDYQAKFPEFMAWLKVLPEAGATLINAPEIIFGTIDKTYLADYAARGFAIPETKVVNSQQELTDALQNPVFADAILKPCVGAGAIGLVHIAAADKTCWQTIPIDAPQLLQRFLPEIETTGEMSFVFFNGDYSHTVRKLPKAGDIRVQSEWGGSVEVAKPDDGLIQQAAHFLTALPSVPTYARVDVVDVDGQLLLMELEVIEPELFCLHVDSAADRFAEALLSAA